MKFNLPTNSEELKNFECADLQHGYMILSDTQKKQWLKAAGAGNVLRLSQPSDDIDAMQVNMLNPDSGKCDGLTCSWKDRDIFSG